MGNPPSTSVGDGVDDLWRTPSPTVNGAVDHVRFCPQSVDRRVDGRVNSRRPGSARHPRNAVAPCCGWEKGWPRFHLSDTDAAGMDRQILPLAVPALGALVAEPLFVLADSAVVGHLGTAPLAGLGSRRPSCHGRRPLRLPRLRHHGGRRAAARRGRPAAARCRSASTGCGSPLGLGVVAGRRHLAHRTVAGRRARGDRRGRRAGRRPTCAGRAPGLPGMLLVLASTGALRGLQDTRTPLVVARPAPSSTRCSTSCSSTASGMGIAGSGLGTALTQLGDGRRADRRRRPRRPRRRCTPAARPPAASGPTRAPARRCSSAPCRCGSPSC